MIFGNFSHRYNNHNIVLQVYYAIFNRYYLGLKKKLFVSCNGMKKNRLGRSVIFFFALFFWSKMCALCSFYVHWELGGWKKL